MASDCIGSLSKSVASRLGRRQIFPALLALGLGPRLVRDISARQPAAEPTLLARGEAELVSGLPVAWRVVRDVAQIGPAADFEERALGFTVATGLFNTLLLTDQATGRQYRLDFHEAAFVADGTSQRRQSLGKTPQSCLGIELVEATVANDARLIFFGPAFTAPTGPITLSLFREDLAQGEKLGLPPGAGETLVLVEQGEIQLEVGEAAMREDLQTVVGSDTVYAVRSLASAATLYGVRDATSVLIATVV